jgi:hypothetical protein
VRTDPIEPCNVRHEIASWAYAGRSLEEIEAGLVDTAALEEEHRSALWLYAWLVSERQSRRRRAEVWQPRPLRPAPAELMRPPLRLIAH